MEYIRECQTIGLLICLFLCLLSIYPLPEVKHGLECNNIQDGLPPPSFSYCRRPMFIECIITCVDYSDFLSHTLLWNKKHFDRLIVVTKPGDWHTQQVCKFHHVECHSTTEFGEAFNKAKGINFGLSKLAKRDWIVHMDADIILPPQFRSLIQNMQLHHECIYGMDRVMCDGASDWFNFISQPELQQEDNVFVQFPNKFKIGTRIFKNEYNGYIPIGYFQLFNVASGNVVYPVEHENAARTDMLFAVQWPREKRILIPEIYCYHISSETTSGGMGKNWNGRVSQKFLVLTEQEKQELNLQAIDKEWTDDYTTH